MAKKQLQVVRSKDEKLGRPTVMDRALAQRHGSPYVHTVAFAIDIDRVREQVGEDPAWPFGWEVLLTEHYLVRVLADAVPDPVSLLEDACLSVMDQARPGEPPPFGSQLPFAVFSGVARGRLPELLRECFRSWKKPPRQLLEELEVLEAQPAMAAQLARKCLGVPLTPPLVQPVREALEELAADSDHAGTV